MRLTSLRVIVTVTVLGLPVTSGHRSRPRCKLQVVTGLGVRLLVILFGLRPGPTVTVGLVLINGRTVNLGKLKFLMIVATLFYFFECPRGRLIKRGSFEGSFYS